MFDLGKAWMINSLSSLSKNLYNSSARFVFELLQNADDNSYSRAKALSADPYVSFHVYNRRIVVECNEDGFTHDNLVAICNVGKSSKSGAQGYIGEKGIGFKSVFMVAWKVLIQSGDFSFYFQHKKGDSGMGMISPVWQDVDSDSDDDATAGPLTRITLFLHDSMLDDAMETTRLQFEDIESTFLLFMKNLKRIDVATYDVNDEPTRFTTYSIEDQTENRVELTTAVSENGETETYSKIYHLTKHIAKGLPKSENRSYTPDEVSRRAFGTAEVVLAFPLDDNDRPIIKSQQVFAFLPIREMGFSVEWPIPVPIIYFL
jgi:HSP90 family molecular chaperone